MKALCIRVAGRWASAAAGDISPVLGATKQAMMIPPPFLRHSRTKVSLQLFIIRSLLARPHVSGVLTAAQERFSSAIPLISQTHCVTITNAGGVHEGEWMSDKQHGHGTCVPRLRNNEQYLGARGRKANSRHRDNQ